jgi:hypothetical protein
MGFSQKVQSKLIQLRGWHQIINPPNLGIDRGHKPQMRNLLRPDTPRLVRVEAFGAEVLSTEAYADACEAALLAVSSRIDSPTDAGWFGLVG